MSFLPEDDRDYLALKEIEYQELEQPVPGGETQRAVLFPNFGVSENLMTVEGTELVRRDTCEVLVMVPKGYKTTKLDSFYTYPRLRRRDNQDPDRANSESTLFGKNRQFWSRHLGDGEWRDGVDGIDTFLEYIRTAMRKA